MTGTAVVDAHRLLVQAVDAVAAVAPRVGLDGAELPAWLSATAAVFAAGGASLRHVEVVARVLGSSAAHRLSPQLWAGAEAALADKAGVYTPAELHAWGAALVEALDQDVAEPDGDDRVPAQPLTAEDDRGVGERQARALAEVCGYVLDHAPAGVLPGCGGQRPHVTVLVRLEDLRGRARAGCLDFGGTVSPQGLRMVCCDGAVVPIVLGGTGQPLDVGRATRTIPDGLRRAVAARDRGCAHPGCGRPVSWCACHHIVPWECGGETKLDNLVMVCRVHHRQTHFTEWVVRIREGLPEFVPPKWIDRTQTARREALPQMVAIRDVPATGVPA